MNKNKSKREKKLNNMVNEYETIVNKTWSGGKLRKYGKK